MEKIKTALIGCGKRGHLHVDGLKRDGRYEIVAICDIKPEAMETISAKFSLDSERFTDYREMLDKVRPELVVQALWPEHRLPVCRACVEYGVKHMVSEKPCAPSFADALEIKRLIEESGMKLSYTHQRRFSPGNLRVRELLAKGAIGEVMRLDLYAFRHLLDCGTHTLDQVWSYIGYKPIEWVMGSLDLEDRVNWFDTPGEGYFAGTLKYKDGPLASIYLGFDGLRPDKSGVTIWGSEGFMELDWEGKLYAHASASMQSELDEFAKWTPGEASCDNIPKMWNYIAERELAGDNDLSEIDYTNAFNAVEVIFALYESVRTTRRIHLPLKNVTANPLLEIIERS